MSKSLQLHPINLKSPTFSPSNPETISLAELPNEKDGRLAHLVGFVIDVSVTPTFTTAPTVKGLHDVVKSLVFFDGINERFNGSLYDVRVHEIAENGRVLLPDPDTDSASTNAFQFRRILTLGPKTGAGWPSDYMLPCSAIKDGELRFGFGALTDISADTTAATVVIKLTAIVALLDDELRIAPMYERRKLTGNSAELVINGRALYHALTMVKSTFAAWAAGDLSTVSIETGLGTTANVNTSVLEALALFGMNVGSLGMLHGEPRSATDDNLKRASNAATTVVAADATFQSVISSPEGMRISKYSVDVPSSLKIGYSGTWNAAWLAFISRICPMSDNNVASYVAKAASGLKRNPRSAKVKTLTKDHYAGPRAEFMPHTFKL